VVGLVPSLPFSLLLPPVFGSSQRRVRTTASSFLFFFSSVESSNPFLVDYAPQPSRGPLCLLPFAYPFSRLRSSPSFFVLSWFSDRGTRPETFGMVFHLPFSFLSETTENVGRIRYPFSPPSSRFAQAPEKTVRPSRHIRSGSGFSLLGDFLHWYFLFVGRDKTDLR